MLKQIDRAVLPIPITIHDSSALAPACPCGQCAFAGGVERGPQSIEADAEPGFFAPAMGFSSDGAVPHCLGGASIGPTDGQGEDAEQGGKLPGGGYPCILQVQ